MKVSKSIILLVKSFLGNFYRYLAIFSGHTDLYLPLLEEIKETKGKCSKLALSAKCNKVGLMSCLDMKCRPEPEYI